MSDFTEYLAQLRLTILGIAEDITAEKEIPYGHQFTAVRGQEKATVTAYNGKKGIRLVVGGSKTTVLYQQLEEKLNGSAPQSTEKNIGGNASFKVWAGSDESGKGDFFGPLVVAAVIVDDSTAARLRAAGVKDCKLLTDKKILELEHAIMDNVIAYSVLQMKPKVYNFRYEQVAGHGGNLNRLLGLGHIAALTQVLDKHPACEGALIDQFTPSDEIIRALKQKFPDVYFAQQPKAESNLAVAAASVLARASFLRCMEELSAQAGMELPKGGGEAATKCAVQIAEQHGKAALREYVKMHFANYKKI